LFTGIDDNSVDRQSGHGRCASHGFLVASFSGIYSISHTNGTGSNLCYELPTVESGPGTASVGIVLALAEGDWYRRIFLNAALPSGLYQGILHTQNMISVTPKTVTVNLRAQASVDTGIGFRPNNLVAFFVSTRP